ncbi:MAG: 23S rRNA (uracil(1939)-C(5))-methyltransferase RlmD [Burkholderiaceae bacterium]|jgi:23S rRNA (uracil1939-C5)-methyltransferase
MKRDIVELEIESLDLDAQGIAHRGGKVVFVEGALPGERVRAEIVKVKSSFEKAQVVEVLQAAAARTKPVCPSFGTCGGCAMQHLEFSSQVAIKARAVENQLWHIGRVKPQTVLRPLQGPSWEYRHRARLTCRLVPKKGGMLVGFHEKKSSFVTDMQSCAVLPRHVSQLLSPLRSLLEGLSIAQRVPQIELSVGHDVTALVLRHLEPLAPEDEQALRRFADRHDVQWWLQPAGPGSAWRFYPNDARQLHYRLPQFDLMMPFHPTDFTQVNHQINQAMVRQAIRLLNLQPHERVADFFCGLGNFSLPLARLGNRVVGIEGSADLTRRAMANAELNGLAHKVEFHAHNLFEVTMDDWRRWGPFDAAIVDPPREGALALCLTLAGMTGKETSEAAQPPLFDFATKLPGRIVYVSCNPATLARDAAILVHQAGYRLIAAGAINMFPHTSHVESMALFVR